MKLKRALELMRKYSKCPKCGSEMIGNEAGTLEIDDDIFRRTCKCGWAVVVKEKGDDAILRGGERDEMPILQRRNGHFVQ